MLISALPAFGVTTSHWSHTSEADFKRGVFRNVVATNLGDLKLSRAVKTLLEQDSRISSVYALAEGADQTLYAGTGPQGVLLQIKDGKVSTLAELEDGMNIFSLLIDQKSRLLIGVGGEKGRILRINKPGDKPEEIFAADGVQYIWAMSQTPDGMIYAATGPHGRLFEIQPSGEHRILFKSSENNLLSLVSDGKEMLYVGTDPNGLVYRINRKTGEEFVLYDAVESEISALAMDDKGNLYAATAEAKESMSALKATGLDEQSGRPESGGGIPIPAQPPADPEPPELPDPNPGKPEPIPKSAATKFFRRGGFQTRPLPSATKPFPMQSVDKGGFETRPYLLSAIGLQEVEDDPEDNPDPPQKPQTQTSVPGPGLAMNPDQAGEPRPDGNAIYQIDPAGFVTEIFRQPVLVMSLIEKDGVLLVGTGSEGLIYQVNPAAEETIVLAKVDPKQVMCLLPGSDGRIYMGLANTGGIAAMSAGFADQGTYTSPVLDAQQISRFGNLQLRGTLPGGSGLNVSTRSGNVRDADAGGWSQWSDPLPAAEFVQVPSAPARFLQYRLTFTTPQGNKSPVVEDVDVAYQTPNLSPRINAIKITQSTETTPAAANADQTEANDTPNRKQSITWEATDPNSDAMQYTLYFRSDSRGPWILLKEDLKEPKFEWNTRSAADGRYEVKVVATDAAANAAGQGRSAGRVSDAVIIDNTAPAIGDLKWQAKGDKVQVQFRAADRTSTVANVEYSIDSNEDWQAVPPSDSIFDGPEEKIDFTAAGLSPGPHQLTIRATDARGNRAFESVLVRIEALSDK